MFPILQVGPLAVQVAPLLLMVGLWLGLNLAEREAARLGASHSPAAPAPHLTGEALYNLALVALAFGLIGARLMYALRYIDAYRGDPLALLSPNPSTLAGPEGLALGLLAALLYGAWRKLPFRPTLDALAPLLAALGVAVALSHVASGDAFGAPTRVPWRIFLWDDFRHPSQVYELVTALATLAAWLVWRRRYPGGDGRALVLVVALSAGARLFLEGFRGDSLLLPGNFRAAQVIALAVLAAALFALDRWGWGRGPRQ